MFCAISCYSVIERYLSHPQLGSTTGCNPADGEPKFYFNDVMLTLRFASS